MPEEYSEFEDEQSEQENDKERNFSALRKKVEAAEKRAAEAEASLAEEKAAKRTEQVAQVFSQQGLPSQLSGLYPADGEVTEEAVAEWAANHGVAPQPRSTEAKPEPSLVDRYNEVVSQAFAPPGENENELWSRLSKGVQKALDRKTLPTPEEIADQEELTPQVNAMNRAYERAVEEGRAKPFTEGFGGKLFPPAWANRAAQAREAG